MTETTIEQALKAAGADKFPRITPAHVEGCIKSEHFFTAKEGLYASIETFGTTPGWPCEDVGELIPDQLGLLTFCVLVLKNGFTVTGESACASPENFNAEIGRKIARQNAVEKIWMLEGYLLREKLAG